MAYAAGMTHRVLLDTSSLMYRAFFSVPPTVRSPAGDPVNAVYGYLEMTTRLLESRRPDDVVHVYDDDWRPAQRVAAYAGYKAARPPDPAGLPEQFTLLRRILDAIGMAQADAAGWEAEDAIGSLCARAGPKDQIDIVTGDRDLIQLVRDPTVRVLFTLKGVSEVRVLDEAGVLDKYGVPAARYGDFALLRGDPSDGLPGVRGVGEKTARELVRAYPDIPALIADAQAIRRSAPILQRSRALRSAIRDAAEYLEAVGSLMPIRTDLEVRSWQPDPDEAALAELAEANRLTGPVRRLKDALAASRR
jgi:5'-3' exonuclease